MSLNPSKIQEDPEDIGRSLPFQQVILMVLVVLAGVLFALNILPALLPGMVFSVTGDAPKVFWFLSRGSAIAAYWLLWLSMCSGVIITNKLAQLWPGIPPAYEIHEYTSLLGLCFALFHALILTGDRYIAYTVAQVLTPFASANYRPVWVGIGQLSFYVWGVVTFSFYVRKRIGKKAWRLIHFLSYGSLIGAMVHGIFSGTDTPAVWTHYLYWFSGASLLFLTVYRVLVTRIPHSNDKSRQQVRSATQETS
jgi:predicted ferric reductase